VNIPVLFRPEGHPPGGGVRPRRARRRRRRSAAPAARTGAAGQRLFGMLHRASL